MLINVTSETFVASRVTESKILVNVDERDAVLAQLLWSYDGKKIVFTNSIGMYMQ